MNDERSFERTAREWLELGANQAPDRAVQAVLLATETTPQERDLRIPWRFPRMNTPVRVAAAAVIGVLLLGGAYYLFGGGGEPDIGGSATPTPSPAPSPSPSGAGASPFVPEFPGVSDDVAPGTYLWAAGGATPADITFTIPAGWMSRYGIPHKDRAGPGEIAFGNWIIANVYTNPCQWQGSLLSPAVGPTVDDLASALVAQKGRNASAPTDVTLGGYPAKRVELSIPADLDRATCDEGVIRTWVAPGEDTALVDNPENLGMHSGQLNVVYIVDVNGDRLVIDTWHMPGTSAEDLAELEAILASLRIEP